MRRLNGRKRKGAVAREENGGAERESGGQLGRTVESLCLCCPGVTEVGWTEMGQCTRPSLPLLASSAFSLVEWSISCPVQGGLLSALQAGMQSVCHPCSSGHFCDCPLSLSPGESLVFSGKSSIITCSF